MAIQPDSLSLTFAALADPTRRAILARLAQGEADVNELMRPFALNQSTISKHLKVLEHAGLVLRGREAQRRPRRLVATSLREVDQWLESYRKLWEDRFASLDDHLAAAQPPASEGKRGSRRSRGSKK